MKQVKRQRNNKIIKLFLPPSSENSAGSHDSGKLCAGSKLFKFLFSFPHVPSCSSVVMLGSSIGGRRMGPVKPIIESKIGSNCLPELELRNWVQLPAGVGVRIEALFRIAVGPFV